MIIRILAFSHPPRAPLVELSVPLSSPEFSTYFPTQNSAIKAVSGDLPASPIPNLSKACTRRFMVCRSLDSTRNLIVDCLQAQPSIKRSKPFIKSRQSTTRPMGKLGSEHREEPIAAAFGTARRLERSELRRGKKLEERQKSGRNMAFSVELSS
ncbi:hypothetical protein MA16_Dca020938 [Dendrobium catenatum]|uniref:Uncharacterized protein n=1 Tax=Dendrobium catenatum TaxID=906689 RepID=A0A2I0VZ41_9ASPA|nr:hypothetical protein MA16_Dca020938 [Dendrobium catenatum]